MTEEARKERARICHWIRNADPWHGLHPDTADGIARLIERGAIERMEEGTGEPA